MLRPGFPVVLCLALLVIFTCIPVHAADPGTSAVASLPVQQAYLAWMAEMSDAEMVATISYVETLYGADTGTLTYLHTSFSQTRSAIGSIATLPELNNQTSRMQKTVLAFNREAINQTSAHQKKIAGLRAQTGKAVIANPYITMRKDAYWSARRTQQLADFDAWVDQIQKSLDSLQAQGFSVTDT